jgi:hypothetical protein
MRWYSPGMFCTPSHDQEPHVHLDWVGDDTLHGTMEQLCPELGLRSHVTFHGFKPSDKLASSARFDLPPRKLVGYRADS